MAIGSPEGPYLELAWKEEGAAAILTAPLCSCGRSQNCHSLLLPPLFTDLDRQRGVMVTSLEASPDLPSASVEWRHRDLSRTSAGLTS